jgi:4-amino-4-deoxychorismate lyase
MCRLFETIRIMNGVPLHLSWHETRMNLARLEFWNIEDPVLLEPVVLVPPGFSSGLVRCNISYDRDIHQVSFKKYEKRIIRSLKMVHCADIDYHVKYTDRSLLESLFALRGNCDEIIIVKNGLITDTSMSNLAFFDGTKWVTPANPLLKGTCRNRLLAEGVLVEHDISPGELPGFTGCKLINAMRDPSEELMIPVTQIF